MLQGGHSEDLTVTEAGTTVNGGTYGDIIISESVGEGDVLLKGVVIKGNLIINGGGSNSVTLDSVDVSGNTLVDSSHQTRVLLKGDTTLKSIESKTSFIFQSELGSAAKRIVAHSNITIKGDNTSVTEVTMTEGMEITMQGGNVENVVGKNITVTGNEGSIDNVDVSGTVVLNSNVVVNVKVTGSGSNVSITGDSKTTVDVTNASDVTVDSISAILDIFSETNDVDVELNGSPANVHTVVKIPDVEPTCTAGGHKNVRECSKCGLVMGGTYSEPLGHRYATAEYEWVGERACVATSVCINDPSHILTENAKITTNMIESPTFDTGGLAELTATFENDVFKTQIKPIVLEGLGTDLAGEFDYLENNGSDTVRHSYRMSILKDHSFVLITISSSSNGMAMDYTTGKITHSEERNVYVMEYSDGRDPTYATIGLDTFKFCNQDGTTDGFTTIESVKDPIEIPLVPGIGNNAYGYHGFSSEKNGKEMQRLYHQMYVICESFTTNDSDLEVIDGVCTLYSIDIGGYGLSIDEVLATAKIFLLETPSYYWLSNTISIENGSLILEVYPAYADKDVRRETNDRIKDMIRECESRFRNCVTELDKVTAIHDYVCDNLTYAYESDGVTPEDEYWAHNLTGSLVLKKGVCEAYADTFQFLASMCGIESIMATGVSDSQDHVWNLVKIDGDWYGVDATWNDKDNEIGTYDFLGMSDERMRMHYDIESPDEMGVEYLYKLPEISSRGIEIVELFENERSLGTFVNIDSAFESMTSPDANYAIKLFEYSRQGKLLLSYFTVTHRILSDETPTVGHITISGYHEDLMEGYYINPSVEIMSKDMKVESDLTLEEVQIRVYDIDLKDNVLTLCREVELLPQGLDMGKAYSSEGKGEIVMQEGGEIHISLDLERLSGTSTFLRNDARVDTIAMDSITLETDHHYDFGTVSCTSIAIFRDYNEHGSIDIDTVQGDVMFMIGVVELDYYVTPVIGNIDGFLEVYFYLVEWTSTTDMDGNEVDFNEREVSPVNFHETVLVIENKDGLTGYRIHDSNNNETLDHMFHMNEMGEIVRTYNEPYDESGFYISDGTIIDYIGTGKNVTIPDGIRKIGKDAFSFNDRIESVTLPDSVVEIDDYAFYKCRGMKTIDFGSGLERIGHYALSMCDSLKSLDLPDSIVSIGSSAFSSMTSLKTINIPAGLEVIPKSMLSGSGVESLVIPDNISRIEGFGFLDCRDLKYLDFSNVESYGMDVVNNCSMLEGLVVPDCPVGDNRFPYSVKTVYFKGTIDSTHYGEVVSACEGNTVILCYSEEYREGHWHYVNGMATPW